MPCPVLPVWHRKKCLLLFPTQESVGSLPNSGSDDCENQSVDNNKCQILHNVPPVQCSDYRISVTARNVKEILGYRNEESTYLDSLGMNSSSLLVLTDFDSFF